MLFPAPGKAAAWGTIKMSAEDRSLRRHYPDQVRWVDANHVSQPFGTPTDGLNLVSAVHRGKASWRKARLCTALACCAHDQITPFTRECSMALSDTCTGCAKEVANEACQTAPQSGIEPLAGDVAERLKALVC